MDAMGIAGGTFGGISPGNVKLLKVVSAENGNKTTVGNFSFLEIHMYGTNEYKSGIYVNPILYMVPNSSLTVYMSSYSNTGYSETFSTTSNSVTSAGYTGYTAFVYSIT